MKRQALGRGLSALIPDSSPKSAKKKHGDYYLCPVEKIKLGRSQPRQIFDEARLEELAASIKEQGVVQPLIVRPGQSGTFILVAGERRWRAAQKAGLREVPVVIRSITDKQAFEVALVENIQREDLNPIEEAEAYQRLLEEHGYTQEKLAKRVGRERSTVANSMRLLKLPQAAQQALSSGSLATGSARALLGLDRVGQINKALKQVIKQQLSARQTEALVKRIKNPPQEKPEPAASANVRNLQQRLRSALKTTVHLTANKQGNGKIEITYNSLDELDRLLEVLLK